MGMQPLYEQAKEHIHAGDSQGVFDLLDQGLDVNYLPPEDGYMTWKTLLHVSALKNNEGLVQALLDRGADPNLDARLGYGPAHSQARHGTASMLTRLLEAGMDPNLPGEYGNTPLHEASSCRSPENIEALLAFGANPNVKNKEGMTPLHVAIQEQPYSEDELPLKPCPKVIHLLLDAGADPHQLDPRSSSPLGLAVSHRAPLDVVERLLEAGGDPNTYPEDLGGSSPMALTLMQSGEEREAIKDLLVKHGGNVNQRFPHDGVENQTLLHLAVEYELSSSCKWLLKNKADPEAVNGDNKRPLDMLDNPKKSHDFHKMFSEAKAHSLDQKWAHPSRPMANPAAQGMKNAPAIAPRGAEPEPGRTRF